jgi:nitrate reductase NapAB chaperone NapD
MPIKSYLAHPHSGKKSEVIRTLSSMDCCEVIPAENKDLLIVITDTNNNKEEDDLKTRLESVDSIKLLAMVSGFNAPKN